MENSWWINERKSAAHTSVLYLFYDVDRSKKSKESFVGRRRRAGDMYINVSLLADDSLSFNRLIIMRQFFNTHR